ncbi:MAG: T9SS type A sorting domain-containing protein [Cytophagaceae bacterium]
MRVALLSLIKSANVWFVMLVMSTLVAVANPASIDHLNGINNPPVWNTLPANRTTCLGEAVTPITFNVSDPENDNIAFTVTSSNTTLLPNANLSVTNVSGNNWRLNYTPAAGQTGTANVTIQVTDIAGNQISTIVIIKVNPLPTVTAFTSTTTVCAGASVTFTAAATNAGTSPTYQWYNGATAISGATSTTYATTGLANGDVISVKVTATGVCTSTYTASSNNLTMTVNPVVTPSVTIAASPSGTICAGTSVTFTATPTNGGATPAYQWYNGATAITSATNATYTSTGLANGNQISVRMVSNASCASTTPVTSNTVTMSVTTSVTPSVTIAASATTICAGTSVTFTATPTSGGTAPTYQWYNGTTAITSATNATYTSTGLANGNQISVRMVSNASCASTTPVTSNTVTMTVTTSVTPSVVIAASATTICAGASVTFTATPTNGGAAPTYQWYNGATAIASATNATYTSTGLANGNQISVNMVSNATCASTTSAVSSNTVTMTVNATVTPSVVIAASATTICAGASVTFTATPTNGGTTPAYQWYTGATTITGATLATYTSSALTNGTQISVRLTSNASCASTTPVSSNTITMTVNASVTPSVTIAAVPNGAICAGTSVTFTATPTNGGTAPTYQWYNGTTAITSATNATYTSTALTNGAQISVKLTSNASCASTTPVSSNTITMTVNATVTPSVTISTPTTTVCASSTVTFTATPTNGGTAPTYAWYKNSNPITGATNASYSATGLVNGDAITVRMVSNANCASTTPVTSNAITMTVTTSVTPAVTVNPGTISICAGQTANFTAVPGNGGTAPTYQWRINNINVSAATNSTFSSSGLSNGDKVSVVMVSNSACASTTNATSPDVNVTVTANPTASVSITVNPAGTIYEGQYVTFTANPTNGGTTPAYQWLKGGSPISGATNNTYTSNTLANGDQISVRMNSSMSCAAPNPATSAVLTMSIQPNPSFATSISGPTNVTSNQSNVTYTVPAGSGMQYTWSVPPGATIVSGQGTNSITVNFGTASGNVTLVQTNPLGQSTTIDLPINVGATTASKAAIEASLWTIYPNPSKGDLYIENNNASGEIISVEILDVAGQVIQREEPQVMSSQALKLNAQVTKAGIYFVKIQLEEVQFLKKIIIE